MRRKEQLDLLLEQQRTGMVHQPALDAENGPRLAAAEMFARLNMIEIPSDVEQRIEARVRNQTAALQAEKPHAASRRSLLRLLKGRPATQRAWMTVLGAVAALLLAFLGITSVAANSLPGDPLYGIRQAEQQVALAWTGDQSARASLQLTQLQQAIADLNTVARQHRADTAIQDALAAVIAETRASRSAVNTLPTGQARETLARSLENTLQEERQTLHRLLFQVDWHMRLAFTQQLGALGEAIPTLAQATIVEGTGDTLVITVTGKNFAPGARLFINGSPRGVVLSNTATTLRVQVQASDLPHHSTYTIGVANPDGTAAQVGLSGTPDHHDQPGPGNHPGTPGPSHGGTPWPEDGEHPHTPGPWPGSTSMPGDGHR